MYPLIYLPINTKYHPKSVLIMVRRGTTLAPFPVGNGNKSPQNQISTFLTINFMLSFPDGGDISKEMYGIEK